MSNSLDTIKALWLAFGEERMLDAWKELQQSDSSEWVQYTGTIPENHDYYTIHGQVFIRKRRVGHRLPRVRNTYQPLQTTSDAISANGSIHCPLCGALAYPDSDCPGSTKFVCGTDDRHVFSIWRTA